MEQNNAGMLHAQSGDKISMILTKDLRLSAHGHEISSNLFDAAKKKKKCYVLQNFVQTKNRQ